MIIVVAALEFNTEADRDRAVDLTREVQMATRLEEPGCKDYCFAADPSVPTYLVERGEPVYGPEGEKKAAFFAD